MLPRLNELWSIIISNPSWTAMHIIAHYGISEGLKKSSFTGMMGMRDEASEVMPLHLAAKWGKADFMKAVISLSLDVQFNALDGKGNSLYHYAAQANKETVEV